MYLEDSNEKMRKVWNSHVKVAVCPECGHTEMYLEDLTKLK